VTAAEQPQVREGVPVRAWRAFRRWRRGRPFWGGLVTLIAAFLYYFSVHLKLSSFSVNFGQNGFLAWLIPLILAMCGLLAWLSPAQRIFYGIVAAATSVYGLIAVNLGGFFVGMLVGIVGGSLIAAWSPARPAAVPAVAAEPDDTDHDGAADELLTPADEYDLSAYREPPADGATTAELPSGPLSDELPASEPRSAKHAATTEAGSAPRQWRHRNRGAALVILPVAVAALGLLTVSRGPSAYAETTPCAPAATTTPSVKPSKSTGAPGTSSAPAAAPSSSSPAPAAAAQSSSNPIQGVIDGLSDALKALLGGGDPTPSPSASSSTAAPKATTAKPAAKASTPAAKTSTPAKKKATCTPSSSPAPANAKVLAAPAGQPPVTADYALLTTDTLAMHTLSYDGVYDLPLKGGGTVQVLKFSMSSADQTPFQLDVPAGGGKIVQTSSKLTISGNVEFYCSRFVGWLLNLVKFTFTPDAPPPLTLPEMTFNRAEIQLVYVHADKLVAADFGNKTAAG